MNSTRHIFLKGPSGAGKTSLLLKCIAPYRRYVGGFITQRLVNSSGETEGFSIQPLENVTESVIPYADTVQNVFIQKNTDGWKKNTDLLVNSCISLISSARRAHKKLLVLDEIGGIESDTPEFTAFLGSLLQSNVHCIGVLKMKENMNSMQEHFPIHNTLKDARSLIEEDLTEKWNCKLLSFSRENSAQIESVLSSFIRSCTGVSYAL